MAFLVTGGAGFIGSHVCDSLLEAGEEVVCIDDFNDFYRPELKKANLINASRHGSFHLVKGDVTDRDSVEKAFRIAKIKTVIHLAARAGVRQSLLNPTLYLKVNVQGTAQVLDAAIKHNSIRFIYGSSSSVFGENKKIPFKETDPLDNIISPYALSKRMSELWIEGVVSQSNIMTSCLRFFTVYGPRGRPDMAVAKFPASINSGKPITVYGDGTSSRDYTFIEDIVAGIIGASKLNSKFEIINLGNSNPIKLSALISILEKVFGKKAIIKRLPTQDGDVFRTWADISKAKKLLGYSPKISLEEGVKRYASWLASK